MVLPSLSLSKKSPKLKASGEGRFSPVSDKFTRQSGERSPALPAIPSVSTSPLSSPWSSTQSSPLTIQTSISSSSATSPSSRSGFSSPSSTSFAARKSPPKSPDIPSSLVFRDLDRYPQIVRHVVTSTIEPTSPSPTSPTPETGPFPKRQSSIKTAKTLLSAASLMSPCGPLTTGRSTSSKTTTTSALVPAVPEVPEESTTVTPEPTVYGSNNQSRSSASTVSYHTQSDSLSSDIPSAKSIAQHPKHPSQSSTSSGSSTSSLPLQAVQVRVASFTSLDSTPRRIRISGSPDSKRSAASSTAPEDSVGDVADDSSDYDSLKEPAKGISKTQRLLEKTHSQMKRIHLPELQIPQLKAVSSDSFPHFKSSMTTPSSAKSTAQYNFDLVESLQEELRQVSAELAASIKRELDLEMLLDKYATTNDSDGELTDGSSSCLEDDSEGSDGFRPRLRYNTERFEDLETKLRMEQQEKARLRLEFQHIVDKERQGRRECEEKRKKLEEQLKSKAKSGKKDALLAANIEATENVRSLEVALEEAQRKLYNERMNAQNLEFMLTSIREELQDMSDKSPAELESRARSSIASLNMLQRYQIKASPRGSLNSGSISPDLSDPESMKARIDELESQRDALQEALRSLKERHALEVKQVSEQAKSLQSQLNRARDLAKAIATRRVVHDKDMALFRQQLDAMKLKLAASQEEKTVLEINLKELKENVTSANDEGKEVDIDSTTRQGTEDDTNQKLQELTASHDEALARIADLNKRLRRRSSEIRTLSDDFEKERQETRSLVRSLEDRVAKAEEQQRKAHDLAEERSVLLRTLSCNRKQMKEEHDKMTEDLDASTKRLQDFVHEIQEHVESNRDFASRFAESVFQTKNQTAVSY
ncbi:hypothetical protein POJ06DRAFT_272727 [Lipomyces tetrasporus]|uniref:Uncharacterized protein n=1 Tax=Lipomyces tetrasporus TaxID=54092 RepID=A0AAD7QZ25_9ASCO|nr:uncharacterized protein POJ06DRAFT_272727 [Lipomyces tetrasporus]KAJ8104089.1 hypothetical protein POJ06DRAFT_272727 [Lipomyces tetrasporus]